MAADTAADRVVAGLVTAWTHADGNAFGAQFWPDARFVNILGGVYEGRGTIAQQHADIFATIYKGTRLKIAVVHTRALGRDHLIVETQNMLAGVTSVPPGMTMGPGGTFPTRFALVLERRAGEWRILFAQNTVVAPQPPARR